MFLIWDIFLTIWINWKQFCDPLEIFHDPLVEKRWSRHPHVGENQTIAKSAENVTKYKYNY